MSVVPNTGGSGGSGWTCNSCGTFVFWGLTHSCPNTIRLPLTPTTPVQYVSWPTPRPPMKCPVCEGKTRMPNDFYPVGAGESALAAEFVTCRSCEGRGIV